MDRLAIQFGRHRSLLACCVVAYTGVCLYGVSRVTYNDDPWRLLQSDKVKSKWLDPEFAHLEHTAVIVVEGDDLLTPEGIGAMRRITRGAVEVEGVAVVYSMLDVRHGLSPLFPGPEAPSEHFERARRRAASHPLLTGHLLSEDTKTALAVVHFFSQPGGTAQRMHVLDQLRGMLAKRTEGSLVRARITGPVALEVEHVANMHRDIVKLSIIGAGLVIVIAILLFRRIGPVLLVASGPAVGVLWTVGTLGLIGEPVNMLTNVVPILVLVIGFTDSMHLVLHVRRAMAEGSSGPQAAQSAIRHLGLACALTSLSTAVGFGSLTLANVYIIQTFGWCCAVGSVLSFFAVITVVPLLAGTPLGKFVVATKTPRGWWAPGLPADAILSGLLRHSRLVLVCGIALTLTLALLVTQLEPDHKFSSAIPHSSEAYQALEHVEKTFGGMMFAYAIVQCPEGNGPGSQEMYDVLEEVHGVLEEDALLSNPLSILNLVKSLPGEQQSLPRRAAQLRYVPREILFRLISRDRKRAVVSVHVPDVGARLLNPAFDNVERRFEAIARRHPGFHLELAGAQLTLSRAAHLMIEDLWRSLTTAAGVMFLMIMVGLRSLRYGLASILPNVFPLLCAGAFIVLSGRYLEMSSVVVFSISLGIAVDDTIHFLVHFKREMQFEPDPHAAVRRTFKVVGTALVMTTVALVAGHGVVMMSNFPAIRTFGTITALTIASALVGDLLILPAILVSLRWPGKSPAQTESRGEDPPCCL